MMSICYYYMINSLKLAVNYYVQIVIISLSMFGRKYCNILLSSFIHHHLQNYCPQSCHPNYLRRFRYQSQQHHPTVTLPLACSHTHSYVLPFFSLLSNCCTMSIFPFATHMSVCDSKGLGISP